MNPIGVVGTVLLPASTSDMSEDHISIYEKIRNGTPLFFEVPTKQMNFFGELEGTLRETLDGIADQNVTGPLIIIAVELETSHSGKTAVHYLSEHCSCYKE